jgi:hypothetical protein
MHDIAFALYGATQTDSVPDIEQSRRAITRLNNKFAAIHVEMTQVQFKDQVNVDLIKVVLTEVSASLYALGGMIESVQTIAHSEGIESDVHRIIDLNVMVVNTRNFAEATLLKLEGFMALIAENTIKKQP